jgi:hypothetical protein
MLLAFLSIPIKQLIYIYLNLLLAILSLSDFLMLTFCKLNSLSPLDVGFIVERFVDRQGRSNDLCRWIEFILEGTFEVNFIGGREILMCFLGELGWKFVRLKELLGEKVSILVFFRD